MTIATRQSGLTLIELMVVLALSALVTMMAIPALDSLLTRTQRGSLLTELSVSFRFARSEAVKLAAPVSLCPSDDSASCLGGGDPDWSRGWIVFLDGNADLHLQSGDRLLRVFHFGNPHYSLKGGGALRRGATFRPSGFTDDPGTLHYCERDGGFGSRMELSAAGRLHIEKLSSCAPS